MAPNSHVVKWLVSSYRRVLRKLRIKEAIECSPACVERAPRMGALESLENRVMLSSTTLDITKTAYTGSPFLVSNMQTVLKNGINAVADNITANSVGGKF